MAKVKMQLPQDIITNLFSHSVMSNSLWPHELQHARLPCPWPTPRTWSNSCPLSLWCHSGISSSVIPFSSRLQSFLASESFVTSQFFASGGQSIGVSASASVLPMNIQGWFLLGLTVLIFIVQWTLKNILQHHNSRKYIFQTQPSWWSNSHIHIWLLEKT